MQNIIANILLVLLIVVYFASLYKIFQKAGRTNKAEGFIPGYNLYIWLKIMNKPWWWLILMLIPGVNLLMLFVLNVELARTFNLRTGADAWKMVLLPWYFVYKIAYDPSIVYVGPLEFKDTSKPRTREWFDALLFAVIAATIIRTFFLEAFTIPTPSMEKNLLVGDFLFVSKVSYGAKLPETPVSFPFTHNTMPVTNGKSYLEIFTLPHMRLPGFGSVKRNDVVVFNFPAGDSVIWDNTNVTYYQVINDQAFENFINGGRWDLNKDTQMVMQFEAQKSMFTTAIRKDLLRKNKIIARPVDKRDNYIKRCVGIPGDVIEVRDRQLYVNGEESGNTDGMQFNYIINSKTTIPASKNYAAFKTNLKVNYDINSGDCIILDPNRGIFIVPLNAEKLAQMEQLYGKENVKLINKPKGHYQDIRSMIEYSDLRSLPVFPNHIAYDWTEDNFGPLKIPSKGETIELNRQNLPLYTRIIDVYEKNDLELRGEDIFINGEKATSYTFKMNYYWLMGDNRQNSADSRFWGFVPDDHIVGKAVLIWFSKDPETGIRWNRIFKGIR